MPRYSVPVLLSHNGNMNFARKNRSISIVSILSIPPILYSRDRIEVSLKSHVTPIMRTRLTFEALFSMSRQSIVLQFSTIIVVILSYPAMDKLLRYFKLRILMETNVSGNSAVWILPPFANKTPVNPDPVAYNSFKFRHLENLSWL